MTATFVLAVVGVVLSVASLVWQLANYVLTGPRISVQLLHGVTDDAESSQFSWSSLGSENEFSYASVLDATRELVLVRVRNHGRAPLTIVSVGIAAGRVSLFRYDTNTVGTAAEPLRLEPGDVHVWTADAWPLVDHLRRLRTEPTLRITGVAELGSGRRVHSKVRKAWRLPSTATTLIPGAPDGYEPTNRHGPEDKTIFTAGVKGIRRTH